MGINVVGINGLTAKIPEGLKKAFGRISEKCDFFGFKAYLVGGAVRDMLLGADISDIDITVVGDVKSLAADLKNCFGYRVATHPSFGTVTLQTIDAGSIDIATARRESYSEPAALPKVFSSDIYYDLGRRDFTINSMAVSLRDYAFIDPFGGREDLNNGIIRVLHDKSFEDDPTRIMRGMRFEKRYGFRMDNKTEGLMNVSIAKGYPARLSGERVLTEMEYILTESRFLDMLIRMEDTGLWRVIFGGRAISPLAYQRLERIIKNGGRRALFPVLALMEDIDDNSQARVFSRYKSWFGKLETYRRREKALGFPVGKRPLEPGMLYSLFSGVEEEILEYLTLTADTTSYRQNVVLYIKSIKGFKFYINGEDLEAMGVKPGPRYKFLLDRTRAEIVEKNIRNRSGQLEILKDAAGKGE
ncbi:MAG: hypothetical protein PHS13_07235 [Firmicutes bacterium]|nr:hypothetical protein [Bacillota bacterium]MDD3851390.1 hypothetical protein [Bacillota bacterium]MDD4707814.1 hypothetical protein [Bacillota bacterium]